MGFQQQLNILLVLEDTYEDDLFPKTLIETIRKYNSSFNYYSFEDDENTNDSYSYGPHSIYRTYTRNSFFNGEIYNDKLKINLKSIRSTKQINLDDVKKEYQVVIVRKLNDYYSKLLNSNNNLTVILLDTTIDFLKSFKIMNTNEIYILNSFLYDQIYSEINFKYFLSEFLNFIKNSYETYLTNELNYCFNNVDFEVDKSNLRKKGNFKKNINFDFKK